MLPGQTGMSNGILDIAANRRARKYPVGVMVRRILWSLAFVLYRWSPRPCFGWRRQLLRMFGARIGVEAHVYPTTRIYFPWNLEIGDWSGIGEDVLIYNLGQVTIGKRATISHRAHLCAGTHDYRKADFPLLRPPIEIKDQVWVCAEAFIGPGVTVGEGAVVGARAVVVRDVEPWVVVGGNPARVIKRRAIESPSKD